MKSTLYKLITNSLPNRGWGDFKSYKEPESFDDNYGVFSKSKDGNLKLLMPLYVDYSGRNSLILKRVILVSVCIVSVIVLIVLISSIFQ